MAKEQETSSVLSFDLLEDVLILPPAKHQAVLAQTTIDPIGPLVEYAYHDLNTASLRVSSVSHSGVGVALVDALQMQSLRDSTPNLRLQAAACEFLRTPQNDDEVEHSQWLAFIRRLRDAAVQAGLPKKFAQALAGTFEEMTSNILQHSDNSRTGLAGYRWSPRQFEYTVVDGGIGVMKSLRKHPNYSWIVDAGQALEVAVRDGESEYGHKANRGTGFHALTTNIALRNSILRFRSGDHSYTIDGSSIPILRKLQPCTAFDGFLISVTSSVAQ